MEINQNTLAPYIRIPVDTPPVFLVHVACLRPGRPWVRRACERPAVFNLNRSLRGLVVEPGSAWPRPG
jgi:hypothetical protein